MREFSVTDIDGDILRVDGGQGGGIVISVNEFVACGGCIVELSPEATIRLAENLLRRARKAKP